MIDTMTFGIEFEITLPATARISAGSYLHGADLGGEFPNGWVAKSDSSIRAGRGRRGVEIVSPVLRGANGLRQIKSVLATLNAMGAKVNESCGTHVHVGFHAGLNSDAFKRLGHIVSNFETGIYATTGTKNRQSGPWCQSVRGNRANQIAFRDGLTGTNAWGVARYHVLNITNLISGRRPTVEFRAFSGTLNAAKAIAYVRMCVAIVEKSMTAKRRERWTPKPTSPTSPMARKGEGQTQLTRLFYAIGWTKGRQNHTFGAIEADGLPTIKESKRELVRLAKKYDSAA